MTYILSLKLLIRDSKKCVQDEEFSNVQKKKNVNNSETISNKFRVLVHFKAIS